MSLEAAPSLVLSYAEAARVVRQHATGLATERIPATEDASLGQALGRVLAAPVVADRDQPPFHRATRDGYACRADELNQRPLQIAGVLRAGEIWAAMLAPGTAIEIMTGAPVPSGADCVVMIEHTIRDGSSVRLVGDRKLAPQDNIVSAGSEALSGATLLTTGTRLGAQHIAVAAACGQGNLKVFRKPVVSVQATGDELVELDQSPRIFQIRNSNSYSLAAQIKQIGGEPRILPILTDDLERTRSAIEESLNDFSVDLLILSGGVSMGRFDFVENALTRLGAEFFFTGARIQPGKPIVFGRLPLPQPNRWKYFFGLPGNPVSTMVTFTLFVHPLLQALGGEAGAAPRFFLAHLDGEVHIKRGLTRFLPAVLQTDALLPSVRPVPQQGSGDLAGNARANCYLVVPEQLPEQLEGGREDMHAGEIVSVLLIG